MLRFTDGMTLNTSGPLRAVRKADGWYVLGDGMSIPCRDGDDAARELIYQQEAKARREATIDADGKFINPENGHAAP